MDFEKDLEWFLKTKVIVTTPKGNKKESNFVSRQFLNKFELLNNNQKKLIIKYFKVLFQEVVYDELYISNIDFQGIKSQRTHFYNFLLEKQIVNEDLDSINPKQIVDLLIKYSKNNKYTVNSIQIILDRMNININLEEEIYKYTQIPLLQMYQPTLQELDQRQLNFYKKWKEEYLKGNALDVNQSISYVFLYIYELIREFIKDIDIKKLFQEFNKIYKYYGDYKCIDKYISLWKCEASVILGDLDYMKNYIEDNSEISYLDNVLFFREEYYKKKITAIEFLKICPKYYITDFMRSRLYDKCFLSIVENYLNEIQTHKGFYDYYLSMVNYNKVLTDKDFEILETWFNDKRRFRELKQHYINVLPDRFKTNYYNIYKLFRNVPLIEYTELKFIYIPQIVREGLHEFLSMKLRNLENEYRMILGIPKIGEGWISETKLFYDIKNNYPNINFIHHARLSWLGRQHLDIYIPKYNIGIEYQGEQHDRPIEYFGGQDGFNKQKERDIRKRNLCIENNCYIIYVYKGYNIEHIYNIIDNIVEGKDIKLVHDLK